MNINIEGYIEVANYILKVILIPLLFLLQKMNNDTTKLQSDLKNARDRIARLEANIDHKQMEKEHD